MKNSIMLLALLFAVVSLKAQDYMISFAGTGASTTVSTVKVDNLTKGTTVTLNGDDILHLTGVVGLPEAKSKTNFHMSVYPNPVSNICNLNFETSSQGNVVIGLCTMAGQQVFETQEELPRGLHSYSLSGISKGIYILKVTSEQFQSSLSIASVTDVGGKPEIRHTSFSPVADNQATNAEKQINTGLKSSHSIVDMPYSEGDILKVSGKSGDNETVVVYNPATGPVVSFLFEVCTDGSNNHYGIVEMANKKWMAQNLRATDYNDGSPIPPVTGEMAWSGLSTPGYCFYNNEPANAALPYGALYNWYAVNTGKLCPVDWHVPSDTEWHALVEYLGGEIVAGSKLKETGSVFWYDSNNKPTNETGFSAVGGGKRDGGGIFFGMRGNGDWWSSTKGATSNNAWNIDLYYDNGMLMRQISYVGYGYSVRCVKNSAK